MIVSLPFSYRAEATPVRGRKPRQVDFTEKVTVDIPEIADAERVATVTPTNGGPNIGTVRHDGRSLLRSIRVSARNTDPMTPEMLVSLADGRFPSAWQFKDYPLPLVRSDRGTGWTFVDPVDPPGYEIVDSEVREKAARNATRIAGRLAFVGGALHLRCPDPRMILEVTPTGLARANVAFMRPDADDANLFSIPLADFVDDRFEGWFASRDEVGFRIEVHRPDLLKGLDPLEANADRIATGILSPFGAVSEWTRTEKDFEILKEAFAISKAIAGIPEGSSASDAFARFDSLPDGIREKAYPVRTMIRYLRESGWVERSPTQTRAVDLEALGANLI